MSTKRSSRRDRGACAGCACRLLALLIPMLLAWCSAAAAAAETPAAAPERLFIGALAAHFVDETGLLTFDEVERQPALFAAASGSAPNHGLARSAHAALWLRIALPTLDAATRYIVSLDETRALSTRIFVRDGVHVRERSWDMREAVARGRPLLRTPAIAFQGDEIAGRTLYLRLAATSSLRGLAWLDTEDGYLAHLTAENAYFGCLMGILAGLFVYLLATALALRDGDIARLSAVNLAVLVYVVADRAYLETVLVPGALDASRALSIGAIYAIFAADLALLVGYLGLRIPFPRLTRATTLATAALCALALASALESLAGGRTLRLLNPQFGTLVFGWGLALIALAIWRGERSRALMVLACWMPAVLTTAARLALNAAPGLVGASPLLLNGVYAGAVASIVLLGALMSFHIQSRERALRSSVERSETRFRSFAATTSDSYWEADARGNLTFLSGPVCEAAGLRLGAPLVACLDAHAVADEGRHTVARAFGQGRAFRSTVVRVGERDRIRHLAFSGVPVSGTAIAGESWRGVIADVTAEQEALERDGRQRRLAAVGQFAAGIAHEINNLLHPIINVSRRVRDSYAPGEPRHRQMDLVVEAGLHAGTIVSGVLGEARSASDAARRVAIGTAVDESVAAVRALVPGGVTLTFVGAAVARPIVSGGEALQVVSNLVANAVHATHGFGAIAVTLDADGDARSVRLRVDDDGCGMTEETRRRAMEPFFSTRAPGAGTGLGLPMVAAIVRGWGGTLDIRSSPGQGTRVEIVLPSAIETNGEQHAATVSGPHRR